MSTSLLYHAFGIRGYVYVRTSYGRRLVFTVKPDERVVRCSQCRSYNVVRRGVVQRVFKTLPIGRRQIHVAVPIPRVACRDCGCVRQIRLHFADPQRHYTTALERLAVDLCRAMTIQDVAQHLGIQAVATDMAAAYVAAVLDKLPKAALVLDRFHIMKYYNDKLTELRRQVQNAAKAMEKNVLKGLRWVLLMNPENTRGHEDPDKDPRKRLQEALAVNEPLMMAYYMTPWGQSGNRQ